MQIHKYNLDNGDVYCVKIEERPKHLWPGKWVVTGYYEDERDEYYKAEKVWEERQRNEWFPGPDWEIWKDGSTVSSHYDDYFGWNADSPHRYLCTDGVWNYMLIDSNHKMIGEYDSYEAAFEAVEAAVKKGNVPQRTPDFIKGVWDVANNYVFADTRKEWEGRIAEGTAGYYGFGSL